MKAPVETVLRDRYPEIFRFIDARECGLWYSPPFREFKLQVRCTSEWVGQQIYFCPFTGKPLPEGLRGAYFDALEALGLHNGLSDMEKAPAEYRSEAWWIARGL